MATAWQENPAPQSAMSRVETSRQKEQNDTDFAFTIAAARRSEQRRLMAFVRMADYRICDTLHSILVDSVREVHARVRYQPGDEMPVPGPGGIAPPAEGGADAGDSGGSDAAVAGATESLEVDATSEGEAAHRRVGGGGGGAVSHTVAPTSRALFQVQMLLDDQSAELYFEPGGNDYVENVAQVRANHATQRRSCKPRMRTAQ